MALFLPCLICPPLSRMILWSSWRTAYCDISTDYHGVDERSRKSKCIDVVDGDLGANRAQDKGCTDALSVNTRISKATCRGWRCAFSSRRVIRIVLKNSRKHLEGELHQFVSNTSYGRTSIRFESRFSVQISSEPIIMQCMSIYKIVSSMSA